LKLINASALALCMLIRSASAQTPPPVPSQYQDAYTAVNSNLTSFNTTLSSQWNGATSPVAYAPQLQTAISDLTTNLLQPNYYQMTVLSELNSLQALGATAITFHVNFPNLLPSYYANPSDYQAYLNFYTTLVAEIRSRGLKVIIENTTAAVYPGTNGASFVSYYQTLNWAAYMTQRAQLAANIAKLLQPDYLIVAAEPDTEAAATNQPNANTVLGETQNVSGMLAAIQATGVTNVKVGAGSGTWNPLFLQYVQSFVTLPLDTIDMHIYPVNKNNLPNALAAVSIIQTAGKQASMSELWAYKESDADYAANLSSTTIFARDTYSFWSPTDISFLQSMANLANFGNFAFIAPFWSHYLAAYLDYNVYGGQSDASVILASATASTQANMIGAFTPTGLAWENILIASPDKTAPQVPGSPTLVAVGQTASNLSWTPTTDNIGVAAYNVYRNGILIGTVNTPLAFADLGLASSTSYSYTLAAFDAVGNLSPQSAPFVVTTFAYPDKTAPSTPSGFQATPFSDVQMNLNWTPSVDNVGVTGYEIYRGTTPNNISAYSVSPTNSFIDPSVAPSKTYYYQVDAYDAVNNHSARSAIVSPTTFADTMPPTSPANLSVTTQTGPIGNLSWSASVDDYMVGSYQIFRGTTSTSLTLIGGVAGLTFIDTRMASGKTYYYAVAAVDVAKNVSVMSRQVVVTAP
jgi:hypothetical protein